MDKDDEDAVAFDGFLDRNRIGENSLADWELLKDKCSRHSLTDEVWDELGFNDPSVTHLYCTNKKVAEHNAKHIKNLKKPIALVECDATGEGRSCSTEKAMNLEASMYLAVNSKVLLTYNLQQSVGLCNGATGFVKGIVYEKDAAPPSLPLYTWVDFDNQYTGPSFFNRQDYPERKGWFPIFPRKTNWWSPKKRKNKTGEDNHSRTMLPLRLSWAWTIWKAQGQTIKSKVVIDLGAKEVAAGLTYVAFSRVTRFSDIGLPNGISWQRIFAIGARLTMKRTRAEEARLDKLCEETAIILRDIQNEVI